MASDLLFQPHGFTADDLTPEQLVRYGRYAVSITEQRITLKRLALEERYVDRVLAHAPELIEERFAYECREVHLERSARLENLLADRAEARARRMRAIADQHEAAARWRPAAPARPRYARAADDPDEDDATRVSPIDEQLRRLRSRR